MVSLIQWDEDKATSDLIPMIIVRYVIRISERRQRSYRPSEDERISGGSDAYR